MWLYVPVRIDAREGLQIEFVQKTESMRMPSRAMRSRLGVVLTLLPTAPRGTGA